MLLILVWRFSPVTNEEVEPNGAGGCSAGAAAGVGAGGDEESAAASSGGAAGASTGAGATGFEGLALVEVEGAVVGLGWR